MDTKPAPRWRGHPAPLQVPRRLPGRGLARRATGELVALGGRPVRGAIVGVAVGACLVAVVLRLGPSVLLPAYWWFATALVVLAAIDIEGHRIPNAIVYPALLGALPLLGVPALAAGRWASLAGAALGAAAALGAFGVFHLACPAALGFGDVRMAALVGCYLGFLDLGLVALGLCLAVLMAAAWGVALLGSGRARAADHLPLAPFLAGGAMVAFCWGGPLLRLYLG